MQHPGSGHKTTVVMLVDDDPGVLDATTMLLETSGMQVYAASNGDAALAHLASGLHPDVIITDYRLPGYDGLEVIRRARLRTSRELPAIVMTGDTANANCASNTAGLPRCTVLQKPVDLDQLLKLIASATA